MTTDDNLAKAISSWRDFPVLLDGTTADEDAALDAYKPIAERRAEQARDRAERSRKARPAALAFVAAVEAVTDPLPAKLIKLHTRDEYWDCASDLEVWPCPTLRVVCEHLEIPIPEDIHLYDPHLEAPTHD